VSKKKKETLPRERESEEREEVERGWQRREGNNERKLKFQSVRPAAPGL